MVHVQIPMPISHKQAQKVPPGLCIAPLIFLLRVSAVQLVFSVYQCRSLLLIVAKGGGYLGWLLSGSPLRPLRPAL